MGTILPAAQPGLVPVFVDDLAFTLRGSVVNLRVIISNSKAGVLTQLHAPLYESCIPSSA